MMPRLLIKELLKNSMFSVTAWFLTRPKNNALSGTASHKGSLKLQYRCHLYCSARNFRHHGTYGTVSSSKANGPEKPALTLFLQLVLEHVF